MGNPIGHLSGFDGVERILKKFDEIRRSFDDIQTRLEDKTSFRDALTEAQQRNSTEGKIEDAAKALYPGPAAPPKLAAETPSSASSLHATANRTTMEKRLMETLRRELPKHNVPPDLALAVMQAESSFNTRAVSPKGAIGVMQLMPSTAASLGVEDSADLYEPEVNIPTGLRYLSNLLSKYGGDESKALAAYNAGPGAVGRYGGVPPFPETRAYINKVFEIRRRLNEGSEEL